MYIICVCKIILPLNHSINRISVISVKERSDCFSFFLLIILDSYYLSLVLASSRLLDVVVGNVDSSGATAAPPKLGISPKFPNSYRLSITASDSISRTNHISYIGILIM